MRGGTLKGDIEEMVRLVRGEAKSVTLTSRKESQELDIYSALCFYQAYDRFFICYMVSLSQQNCAVHFYYCYSTCEVT